VIVLVRHGETAANRARLALGRADPPLTDVGRLQAEALAERLRAEEIAAVLTSPLQRARETAAAIAAAVGVGVEVDERLVELDYGEWDEHRFEDLPRDEVLRWRTDPSFAAPGGESLDAVGVRMGEWCAERIAGPPVVAVSHVSPIKAGAIWAMGAGPELAWRMFCAVASIARIDAPVGVPRLLTWNDTSHLPPH